MMFRDHHKRIRSKVIERDQGLCAFCDHLLPPKEITLDHIVPASQGGSFHITNLTVACFECNNERDTLPFIEHLTLLHNTTQAKLDKFQRLFDAYHQIQILNLAKEHLTNYYEMPQDAIEQASFQLGRSPPLFSEEHLSFTDFHRKKDIVSSFNHLINLIERDSGNP